MKYTSKEINHDYRMKVSGIGYEGKKLNTLMGVSGVISLIGEELFERLLDRAYSCMQDSCPCKLRRGLKITFYIK